MLKKRKAHDVPTRNREEKRDPIKSGFFEASLPKTGSHNKRSYILVKSEPAAVLSIYNIYHAAFDNLPALLSR